MRRSESSEFNSVYESDVERTQQITHWSPGQMQPLIEQERRSAVEASAGKNKVTE